MKCNIKMAMIFFMAIFTNSQIGNQAAKRRVRNHYLSGSFDKYDQVDQEFMTSASL